MRDADGWFICRVGYVETLRAVGLAAGPAATRAVRDEWASFAVIEVDQRLVEAAGDLALTHGLRSLDALHLAAAALLPAADLVVATWDRRLHAAAIGLDLRVLPDTAPGSD
jgi:predicted nucleic acid-binding protein